MIARILSLFSPSVVAVLALAWIAAPAASRADVIIYNNLGTVTNFQANAGATSATGNTAFIADDLTLLGGYAGYKGTAFAVDVGNSNSGGAGTETANITLEFFATDGTGGGPGTLLGSATLPSVALNAGETREVFTGTNLFTVPANGKIWAGIYFTGVSGSLAALNNLGVELESGGTVGSSVASTYFSSTTPAVAGSPSGSIAANGNGNFGLIASVPEPSSVLFTALIGAGLTGIVARRRKR